jgi:ATP-dependent NAD(P)H-hydrate dehydratase
MLLRSLCLTHRTMSSSSTSSWSQLSLLIPPLSPSAHKGQAGRIGVVGGSADYTGAPFFAAYAAMRLGADLAYNVCTPDAGAVIKTYAPDCIVNTCLGGQQ